MAASKCKTRYLDALGPFLHICRAFCIKSNRY
jgi:hypothetical protein